MIRLSKPFWVIFSIIVLGTGSCSQKITSFSNQNSPTASLELLPWIEEHGRFYTKDVARAQKEIPFTIILPKYIPSKSNDKLLPELNGPLMGYQKDNEVQIEILYVYINDKDNEVPAHIKILESNYPSLPPDPKLNPGVNVIEMRGKSVFKEGNASDSTFWFHQNKIWYVMIFRNIPDNEALKVIKSMIE